LLSYELKHKLHMLRDSRAPWRLPTVNVETCRSIFFIFIVAPCIF